MTTERADSTKTTCCIAGGGPAGMMLGFLLARAGVDVVVLEKHKDFLRDFCGDTIHPSTLELMWELGLQEEFLQRPHQQFGRISARIDGFTVTVADFTHLPVHAKFLALMPQWEFLNFLAEKGKRYPNLKIRMEAEVTDLLWEGDRVAGVRGKSSSGEFEVRAALTIGADGRHSAVRERAKLQVIDSGAPIDVLWMRVSRQPDDPESQLGNFHNGQVLVTLNRGEYWQCAYVIGKGEADNLKQRGLKAFRDDLEAIAPFLRGRTREIESWDQVKLLTVAVDHLRQWWRNRLLCIGDAAHAMSPLGGVGINLAVQDAVAAANLLFAPLLAGNVTTSDLNRVQQRREFPTRVTQRVQVFMHKHVLAPALRRRTRLKKLPLAFRLLNVFPLLRRLPARAVGMGVRPEHVKTPEV
jgi:2-polyprenyl-6-methoxyphenol hydroxylase-like FAD-dependent oxidoreductase